ncbi:MAG: hypothetical protein LBP54_04255, partial [Campylobacteraceae bacterium]|jgi:hypothetical protein|nr:hypothetical protein [Campylobacteraceae bacterium]
LTDEFRNEYGGNENIDKCSDAYKYGKYAGDIAGMIVGGRFINNIRKGKEIMIGGTRIAPLGNAGANKWYGQIPHYHSRKIDHLTGQTRAGQGIGRHRPWETKSTDTGFKDRF